MNRVEDLTKLMAKLSAGADSEKIKIEQKELLSSIKPKDLALAGMNLIDSGMFISDFCKLCRNHLSLIGDPVVILFKESGNSILKRVFSQHREILGFFTQLENVNSEIKAANDFSRSSEEHRKFIVANEQLGIFSRHCEFEHDVLLPELDEKGFMPVTRLIKHQHLDISQCLHGLGSLAKGYYSDMNEFKSKLNAITQSLVSFGRMHIAVEEAILYPIAAEEIANSEVWERYWVFFDQLKQSA